MTQHKILSTSYNVFGETIMYLEKIKVMEAQEIEAIRNDLIDKLKKETLTVRFNKINGDERIMTCTLQESVLPQTNKSDTPSQEKVKDVNIEVLNVWDTNANGWRSFRIDRFIEVMPK